MSGQALFGRIAAEVTTLLPVGPRVVVVGSTSFWGCDSKIICESVAFHLAAPPDLVAVTGGMDGVGLTFGARFSERRNELGFAENLVHLLPDGLEPALPHGRVMGAGLDYSDRREVLGRLGQIYIVIEGGPGTDHELSVAKSSGWPILPIARTGGAAEKIYHSKTKPVWADISDWLLLNDEAANVESTIMAVQRLVEAAFSQS